MSFKGPRVRDFTDQARSLDLVVEASEVYETLIGLYVFGDAEQEKMEYDDEHLIERLKGRLDRDLVAQIQALSPSW